MSKVLDDILGNSQTPAQATKPQVDNSNVGNTTSVQADAAEKAADTAAQQPKPQNAQSAKRDVGASLPKLQGIAGKAETAGSTLAQNTPKQLSYTEMFQKLNPYTPPTEEELEEERKKRKRATVFSALGDGISALSNVYFAAQGSPNMSTGEGATKKLNDRWEKLKQERKENAEKYAAGMVNAARLDESRRNAELQNQHWKATFDLQKAANEAAQKLALDKFSYEKERNDKADKLNEDKFNEGVRQFNVTSAQNEKRIAGHAPQPKSGKKSNPMGGESAKKKSPMD